MDVKEAREIVAAFKRSVEESDELPTFQMMSECERAEAFLDGHAQAEEALTAKNAQIEVVREHNRNLNEEVAHLRTLHSEVSAEAARFKAAWEAEAKTRREYGRRLGLPELSE